MKEIRAKYSTKVIVVSSVAQMGSSRAAEVNQLGVDAIIEKPGGAVDPTLATQKGKEFIANLLEDGVKKKLLNNELIRKLGWKPKNKFEDTLRNYISKIKDEIVFD